MSYDAASFKAGLAVGRILWRPSSIELGTFGVYIQCSGAQWIDTGYYTTPNTRIETVVNIEPYTASSASFLFGNRHTTTPFTAYKTEFDFAFERGSFTLNSGGTYIAKAATTGQKIMLKATRTEAVWYEYEGAEINRITLTNVQPENALDSLCIMTLQNWGTNCAMKGKIYTFKIYEGDILTCDFRPAINNDVVCMYECISKQYFYNVGTGSFVLGVDDE